MDEERRLLSQSYRGWLDWLTDGRCAPYIESTKEYIDTEQAEALGIARKYHL
jgi:hypothetical protein